MSDSVARSAVKTVTWRVLGSSATFAVSWAVTGSVGAASSIAVIQVLVNTVLYFVHERVWQLR